MARFQVHRARHDDLLLIDLQADFLDVLKTRIVAPLVPIEEMTWCLGQLNPRFEIAGRLCVMATQRMAAITLAELGEPVADLSARHDRSRQQPIFFSRDFDVDTGCGHRPVSAKADRSIQPSIAL